MGWFLSSKKKGRSGKGGPKPRSKKLTSKKAAQPRGWDPGRTLANMWLMSWTLLLIGGAAGWYFGEAYLMDYVSRQHRDQPVTVELIDTPSWMNDRLTGHLREEVERIVDADPFDRASLEEAARTLQEKPWVESVQRIIRRGDAAIEVHADYRRPTALIEAEDGFHLVDRQGVRLPGRYSSDGAARTGLLVVEGVSAAPPLAGQRWGGKDLQAGLALAELIRKTEWSDEVASVNVRNYAGRVDNGQPHIVLPTRLGGALRWGRAIGEEQFYEPTAEVKLRHISRVRRQSESGTICAGGRVVDVFRDTIHVHHNRSEQNNSTADLRYTLTSE